MPCMVVSPWSRPGGVSSRVFDHTSVLRMIEWRWSLPSLTFRDATANNLADELDFTQPDPTPGPVYTVPDVIGKFCPIDPREIVTATAPSVGGRAYWRTLRDVARRHGWRV